MRSCSGNVETEILIATSMVIDLVVCLVVVGHWTVGRIYPRESLTLLAYLHLASFRRYL